MTIVPLHHYFRQSHLERVIEQMRTLGAPKIRACHDPVSGEICSITRSRCDCLK